VSDVGTRISCTYDLAGIVEEATATTAVAAVYDCPELSPLG